MECGRGKVRHADACVLRLYGRCLRAAKDLDPWRAKLWDLIERTPHLDWLVLTKRPGHIKNIYPWVREPRENVWLGTTVENQRWANRRIDRLVSVQARVRFLSCEPLLSTIDLTPWLGKGLVNWIIAGGESGGSARPTHPNWVRSLRDQCEAHGVPFYFKQWGQWSPEASSERVGRSVELRDESGRPERLAWNSKKTSGRLLDGRTWDEYPQPREVFAEMLGSSR
jgi:protein gp37